MIGGRLTAGILIGAVTTVVAVPAAVGGLGGTGLIKSPLAKLIVCNVGRWLILRSELNLSDQQRQQIRQVVRSHRTELIEASEEIWQKRVALREQVLADQPDEAAIRSAADDLGQAIGDASVLISKVAGEARPALSEEQVDLIRQCRGECDDAVAEFFDQKLGAN